MMLSAGWIDGDVKRAFTSYDMMISSGPSWMPSRCCKILCYSELGKVIFPPGVSGFWTILLMSYMSQPLCWILWSDWHPFFVSLGSP